MSAAALAAFLAEFPPEGWGNDEDTILDANGEGIVVTCGAVEDSGHNAAALALFKAAPGMVEALRALLAHAVHDEEQSDECIAAVAAARAVIAAAEGR